MPRYVIERNFAEQLNLTKDGVEKVNLINDQEGVQWIFSFLSADKKKTYCLYEAPNPEAIRAAARRNNIPADVIIEIGGAIGPKMLAQPFVHRSLKPWSKMSTRPLAQLRGLFFEFPRPPFALVDRRGG